MGLIESLLDVLALIGIILTGGFLVFFLGDLLLSVLDPNYGSIFKRKKKQEKEPEAKVAEPVQEQVAEQQKVEEKVEAQQVNDFEEEDKITFNDFDSLNNFDETEALKEQEMLEGVAAFSRDDAIAELRAEEERFRQEKYQQALDKKNELEGKENEEDDFDLDSIFVEEEDEDLTGFDFEEEVSEESAEEAEEQPAEEVAEVEEEPAEEPAEEEVVEEVSEEADEATRALMAEIEELKAALAEAQELANKAQEVRVETVTVSNGMTKEDCEAKIEELKARLKVNEKEFKAAKKEYLPLDKIRKRLDSDKKKLRRKEALVAKQKVILYGVNNVVDMDQEKAQKLAEDLDLLEGLRLSVQHCEEVVKDNEERLPLLEKNYNILLAENNNLKEDLARYEELLGTFEEKTEVAEVEAEEVAEVVETEEVAETTEEKPVEDNGEQQ